jgi:hypothetical protein
MTAQQLTLPYAHKEKRGDKMKTYEEMTSDERFELFDQINAALDAGDTDTSDRLAKLLPIEPITALAVASVLGESYVRERFNMSKVDDFNAQNENCLFDGLK